jgi:hypothetical protein
MKTLRIRSARTSQKKSRKGKNVLVVKNQKSKTKSKRAKFFKTLSTEGKSLSLPDRLEQSVPSIWKGIRTLFNFKEMEPQTVIGAVPASYQTIISNQSMEVPEIPCEHPDLGLQGIRFQGGQYLMTLQYAQFSGVLPTGALVVPGSFVGILFDQLAGASAGLPGALLPLNPWNMGGKLAFRAFQYQRFRFNRVRLRFVSTAGVQVTGTIAAGYYKDYDRAFYDFVSYGLTFGTVSDLVPSVSFPQNIAQSEITMSYPGNELYYLGTSEGKPQANQVSGPLNWGDAQNRQEQQGCFALVCDSVLPPSTSVYPTMNVFMDYDIELYDPRPSDEIVPTSVSEIQLIRKTLSFVRDKPVIKPSISWKPPDDPERMKAVLQIVDPVPEQKEPDPISADPTVVLQGLFNQMNFARRS